MKKLILTIALCSGANLFGAAGGHVQRYDPWLTQPNVRALWGLYEDLEKHPERNETAFKPTGPDDEFYKALTALGRDNSEPLNAFKKKYGDGMYRSVRGYRNRLSKWIDRLLNNQQLWMNFPGDLRNDHPNWPYDEHGNVLK